MADEDDYVEAFAQADDGQLTAAIQAREAACAPLLKCELPMSVTLIAHHLVNALCD